MTQVNTTQVKMNFEEMVDEAYKILNVNTKTKTTLILPNLKTLIETTRLIWNNADEIINVIHRPHEHFTSWLSDELPDKKVNWVSSDKKDGLIIHGKYKNDKELGILVLKYINMFVVCNCKSTDTEMKKNQFICNDCGMTKYI